MTGSSHTLQQKALPNRFIWLITGIFILVNLGYGVSSGIIASSQLREDLTRQYKNLSTARAAIVAQPVWQFEIDRAQYILNTFMKDRNVVSARLHVKPEVYRATGFKPPASETKTTVTPVVYNDGVIKEKLGTITITYSMDPVSELLYHRILTSVIMSLLLVLIVALSLPRLSRDLES